MSLIKAIKYGKEKRQPYRKSKAFDYSCHNHGSCKWCEGNRTNKNNEKRRIAEKEMRDFA
jgi:hypothetical protein